METHRWICIIASSPGVQRQAGRQRQATGLLVSRVAARSELILVENGAVYDLADRGSWHVIGLGRLLLSQATMCIA